MKIVYIMFSLLIILNVSGCKDKNAQPSSEKVSKELVDSFKKLDQEAVDTTIRNRWLADRLDAALTELERCHGLESSIFDMGKAIGKVPYSSISGSKPIKPEFYSPYPILTKSNTPTKYESYIYSEGLTAYINMQMRIREPFHLGTDKYVEYLEQRMERLEKYIDQQKDANSSSGEQ